MQGANVMEVMHIVLLLRKEFQEEVLPTISSEFRRFVSFQDEVTQPDICKADIGG